MRLKHLFLVSFSALAVLSLQAADKVDTTKLPPASDKKDLTFDKDIKPILEKSCLKCHGAEKPKADYRVDSKDAFIKGGETAEEKKQPVVVAGKSADSTVVHVVADLIEDAEMPPLDKREKYPALTKEQIGVLRAWIDQGAK